MHVIPGPLWEPLRYRKANAKPAAEFVTAAELADATGKTVEDHTTKTTTTAARATKAGVKTETDTKSEVKVTAGAPGRRRPVKHTHTEERHATPHAAHVPEQRKKPGLLEPDVRQGLIAPSQPDQRRPARSGRRARRPRRARRASIRSPDRHRAARPRRASRQQFGLDVVNAAERRRDRHVVIRSVDHRDRVAGRDRARRDHPQVRARRRALVKRFTHPCSPSQPANVRHGIRAPTPRGRRSRRPATARRSARA